VATMPAAVPVWAFGPDAIRLTPKGAAP
jgi:hypothetical protein